MRRKIVAVLMMTLCLLLTSCSAAENAMKDALTFREVLQEAGGCSFTASVVTEVEERGYAFAMSACYAVGGPTTLTILAPDTIAGIRATMTSRDALLSFDGVELSFGTLDDAMTTPLYAPLVFGQGWDTAYIDCAGADGDLYRVTYRLDYEQEELILETWFDASVPVRCEIYREETLLLSASVEDFTFLA